MPATAGQSPLTPGQDPREEASLTGDTCRRQARVVRLQERRWNICREQHKQHAMSDNTCSHVASAGSSSRTLTTAQTEFIADLEERLRRLEENINLVESPGSFAGRSSSSRQQAEGAEDEQLGRRCNWRHWHVCQPPLPCWQPTPRWRQPDSCCRPASGGRSGEGCQAAHMAMHRTDDREAEAEGGNVGAGRD